jgi:signal peptidase I
MITSAIAVIVVIAMIVAVVRWRWLAVSVHGDSMAPTLRDGQRLVARRAAPGHRCAIGEVIVFRVRDLAASFAGDRGVRIKRVVAVGGDPVPAWAAELGPGPVPTSAMLVRGDNPASEDSRHYGFVDRAQVVGWCALPQAGQR